MHVSRDPLYEDTHGEIVMADVIKDWIEQLIIPKASHTNWKHKIPPRVKFIMCQADACVISKCTEHDTVKCS